MKTASFLAEDNIAKDISPIAKQEKRSKSDVLRDMYENYASGREFASWLDAEQ